MFYIYGGNLNRSWENHFEEGGFLFFWEEKLGFERKVV
jgi:hypothetical protein